MKSVVCIAFLAVSTGALVACVRPPQAAGDRDGIRPFKHPQDARSRGDVLDQPVVERLPLVLAVVLACGFRVNGAELKANNLEATPLQAVQDLADQSALDPIAMYEVGTGMLRYQVRSASSGGRAP